MTVKRKEFVHDHGASTALTLHAVKNWFGSRQIVVADRGFAYVKSLRLIIQKQTKNISN